MTRATDTEPTPAPGQPPTADASRKRLQNYSVANMVYSLLAVFALAFAWWALMPNPDGLQRRTVDLAPVSSWAAEESDLPVWSPEAVLGEEWSANFAHFQTFAGQPTWRVGLVTPAEDYVEISQTVDASEEWLEALTDKAGDEVGLRTITGPDGPQEWTAYEGAERAVVLGPDEDRVGTTVVRGTAEWPEIEEFIGLLDAVGREGG